MSAHSQVNDESEEEDKKGDIFDSNMLSEQNDLEAASPEIKPFEQNTSPIKKEEKKDNDNIIVDNTKIAIPLEFFGEDKKEIKSNNVHKNHNSRLPTVTQKSSSNSIKKSSSNPIKSPSTTHPKPPTESNNTKEKNTLSTPHIGPIKHRSQMIKENDYSGIKKKEYDLVCLSMLEKCIKIISILCNIFEDDKKKELYVSDVIQVLDVVGTFYQKAKGDFASIPFWFKMFKLTHKYVYSLFSLRSISHSQLREMINMESSENKMKRFV